MTFSRLILASLAALLCGSVATASGAQAHIAQNTQPSEGSGRLVLVLDSSGSMEEPDASGQTKIEAARTALNGVVDDLPAGAEVGLRVFGATVFSRDDAGACEDSQLVVPVGAADKDALKSAIAEYKPYGETPIAHALQEAAKDLGSEGPRSILLVSDGEATCEPDPCVVAEQLAAEGIDLEIDVVGLHVDDAARAQLSCIADKGNGNYYDVGDADEFAASLDEVASRALQAFEVNGTPIEGTPKYDGAPEMETGGQYADTIPAHGAQKFYMIKRTTPSSNVIVGVSGQPELDSTIGELAMHLQTADGEECNTNYARALDSSSYSLVAGSVSTLTQFTLEPDDPCTTAEELQLVVEQSADNDIAGTPIQFKLWEYGAVDGYDALPEEEPYADVAWDEVTTDRNNPTPLTAGSSFDTAPEVEAGATYTDTIVPGEMRIFKINAEWGQRIQAQVATDPTSGELSDLTDPAATLGIRLYGPSGGDASNISVGDVMSQSNLDRETGAMARIGTQEIRYRNFESVHEFSNAAAIPGEYYVGVALSADQDGDAYEIPFTLTTSLVGEAGTGEPTFAEVKVPDAEQQDDGKADENGGSGDEDAPEADSTEPVANDSDSGSISPTTIAIGLGGLALLLGGGYGVYRFTRS